MPVSEPLRSLRNFTPSSTLVVSGSAATVGAVALKMLISVVAAAAGAAVSAGMPAAAMAKSATAASIGDRKRLMKPNPFHAGWGAIAMSIAARGSPMRQGNAND